MEGAEAVDADLALADQALADDGDQLACQLPQALRTRAVLAGDLV